MVWREHVEWQRCVSECGSGREGSMWGVQREACASGREGHV